MDKPQSWKQARSSLRIFLKEYLNETPQAFNSLSSSEHEKRKSILSKFVRWNIDLYLGALGSSTVVLVTTCITIAENDVGKSFERQYLRSQLAASVLLVLACFFNVWIVRRRSFSDSRGIDSSKRREISHFLKALEKNEDDCIVDEMPDTVAGSSLRLVGTSLTDIYPVYRLREAKDGTHLGGLWSRIPSLLLIRGDYVALQVGDIAPAACRPVAEGDMTHINIAGGERISLSSFGETSASILSTLPRGRSTLKKDSDELHTLCNSMRVFKLLETPLRSFLREPRVQQRSPQVWRQLEKIRVSLSIVGLLVLGATGIVISLRKSTGVLSLPFLAALGAFPLTGPACLIFMEVLGTARILAAYHPIASRRKRAEGQSSNKNILLRYFLSTAINRLALQRSVRWIRQHCRFLEKYTGEFSGSELVRVPPASIRLLEKLGVATAYAMIDDELACDPQAIPQQLLIPSSRGGLKLLDICPTFEDDSTDDSASESEFGRPHRKSFDGDDSYSSDSDVAFQHHHQAPTKPGRLKLLRRKLAKQQDRAIAPPCTETTENESEGHEVQFEDPKWWQHLPSLKCIGLACLLVDEKNEGRNNGVDEGMSTYFPATAGNSLGECKKALGRLVCTERRRKQLGSLARCIGFSTKKNCYGRHGDATPFAERYRLQIVSSSLLKERLEIDSHERGSEDSLWWGLLRPDATSVIVQDSRSGAYQLLSVGDPRVITRLCQEAWQGESSTILPLTSSDRATILETSNSWKLADLDVAAFSYAPIPHTFESRVSANGEQKKKFYLLDNDPRGESFQPIQKEKAASGEWSLVQNQMFLGILGSLVIPRQEMQGLLSTLQDAGVRFVYFSPRNMRRMKEIASQMGIDVAWNCAISLRPLDAGEEDPHRMVSTYADWDVNAKLPHGIPQVRRHLKEVDNVPLLVSLFTDVSKRTTMEMIETFQEYNDTVITIGLSHLPRNSPVFSTSDLAVGVDIVTDCIPPELPARLNYNSVLPSEITFVSAISAHSCAFLLRGVTAAAHMPRIIARGRASLEAATAATLFVVSGCLSLAFYVLFCSFTVASAVPFVPVMGCVLHLQIIIPLVSLCMTMSDADGGSMKRVPPKNDLSVTFGKESQSLYLFTALKALPPAILPQLIYIIAFGELILHFEPDIVESMCSPGLRQGDWTSVVRCSGLAQYEGEARTSAGSLALAEMVLCTVVASAAYVHRTKPISEEPPWSRNLSWVASIGVSLLLLAGFLLCLLAKGSFKALPWYCYILCCVMPFICLAWVEAIKTTERKHYDRAEKVRRLQFETRLGMWSPR